MRLLPLLIALFVLGCGGEPKTTKARFAATCGTCHTLKAAGTGGRIGPNLDDLRPDAARVRGAIANGPGRMPDNLLEGKDADAMAAYVAAVAGR